MQMLFQPHSPLTLPQFTYDFVRNLSISLSFPLTPQSLSRLSIHLNESKRRRRRRRRAQGNNRERTVVGPSQGAIEDGDTEALIFYPPCLHVYMVS
jgi:hypothetical protein